MNTKQVTKRYEAIDTSYGSSGRNLYSCTEGHTTLITHVDRGVTPMFISCPICGAQAASHGYGIPQAGPLILSGELIEPDANKYWYRPTLEEVLELRSVDEIEHVLRGGLLYRGRKEKRTAKRPRTRRLPRNRR